MTPQSTPSSSKDGNRVRPTAADSRKRISEEEGCMLSEMSWPL